jgi:Phage gp6-like head-tail connector protein
MLITLAEMKTYLGISVNTYDTFLTSQITLISETIELYCRRKFSAADYIQSIYREDYEKLPQKSLMLFHYPVNSITYLKQDTVAFIDYRLHKETGMLKSDMYEYFFQGGQSVIEVSYNAGYTNIPETIRSVVFSICEERYNKKISGINLNFGSDVQRVSIPGTISIDFDYSLSANDRVSAFGSILGSYMNILDYHRSERAVGDLGKLSYVS